ncbi:MAG: CotH kinase family protein [Bacteroidales bacterium]|nr:CotH kinase family protein [Bacteroidales bacterium]
MVRIFNFKSLNLSPAKGFNLLNKYTKLIKKTFKIQHSTYSILLFVLLAFTLASNGQNLLINEVSSSNSTIQDKYGNFEDWIELYNSSDNPLQLSGFYLSDNPNNLTKWQFPAIEIPAKAFLLIFASGLDIKEEGNLHTNFKISNGDEPVILTAPNGSTIADKIEAQELPQDISIGRQPDGSSKLYYFAIATPEKSNSTTAYKKISGAPVFNLAAGFYSGKQKLAISSYSSSAKIIYTTDGSFPDQQLSPDILKEYKGEINIDSTMVIKARIIEDSAIAGKIFSNTYFINVSSQLPVFSISSDPDNFFSDDIGIYVDNNVFKRKYWKRPINVEMYENNKQAVFNTTAETRIFGRTAIYYPQKTLAIYFTGKNNEINYKLFNDKPIDKFKSILLRNSSDDWYRTLFRDGFEHSLVNNYSNVDLMAYRPAILFLNGKYWGIHNIREKINEDYIATNHNVNSDSVNLIFLQFKDSSLIITDLKNGDSTDFYKMLNYIKSNDFSKKETYNYIKSKIDIDNLLDYYVIEIFVSNSSWDHNRKMWNSNKTDSKWRTILYDLDKGYGIYNTVIYDSTLVDIYNRDIIFRRLIKNQDFRNDLIQRMNSHLNTTFEINRAINLINSMQETIKDEMPRHIARWSGKCWDDKCGISSMDYWNTSVEKLRKFARLRPDEIRLQMNKFFKLNNKIFYLNLAVNNSDFGKLKVNNVKVINTLNSYKGIYFADIPLYIKAVAEPGYHFVKWEQFSGVGDSLNIRTGSDITLNAVFEKNKKIENIYINEFCASNSKTKTDENGEYDDWIEIYNAGSENIDIGGLYITDNIKKKIKWNIPKTDPAKTTIPAKGFLILWADNQPEQGILHLKFNLSKEGNDIALIQLIGTDTLILDSLSFGLQASDISYGMCPDGTKNYEFFTTPSPGTTNKCNNNEQKISGLFINELLASNKNTIFDDFYQYDDCLEIYNSNDIPVDIGGLYLSDSLPNPLKYKIPSDKPTLTSIPAKAFLILWADGEIAQGALHLKFKLSASGEDISISQLYKGEINIIDALTFPAQLTDISYGRCPDGGSKFELYKKPTLGKSNICELNIDNINNPYFSNLYTNPNPFNNNVSINFLSLKKANYKISVYNSGGLKVKNLFSGELHTGNIKLNWDGCSDKGAILPEGLYFLLIESSDFSKGIKLMKIN